MVGARDVQELRHANPMLLRERDGERDFARLARDDDLSRSVQIGHVHIAFRGERAHRIFISANHGGHGAIGLFARFLHERAALRHQSQTGGEIKSAGGRVRREFTE